MRLRKTIKTLLKNKGEFFPANFQLVKRKKRVYGDEFLKKQRKINLPAYETDDVIIDRFYKKISRTLI